MHFCVVHVLPEIPFMARAETKVSLSRRQWPRQKHNAILSKFETAAAFSIALASKSSNEQLLSKDCHNVRQHNPLRARLQSMAVFDEVSGAEKDQILGAGAENSCQVRIMSELRRKSNKICDKNIEN